MTEQLPSRRSPDPTSEPPSSNPTSEPGAGAGAQAGAETPSGKKIVFKHKFDVGKGFERPFPAAHIVVEGQPFFEAAAEVIATEEGEGFDWSGGWAQGLQVAAEKKLYESGAKEPWYGIQGVKWVSEATTPLKTKEEDVLIEIGTKIEVMTNIGGKLEVGVKLIEVSRDEEKGLEVNAVAGTLTPALELSFDPASIVDAPKGLVALKGTIGCELTVQPNWKQIIAEQLAKRAAQAGGEAAITASGVTLVELAAIMAPVAWVAACAYAVADQEEKFAELREVQSGGAEQKIKARMRDAFHAGLFGHAPPEEGGRAARLAHEAGREWSQSLWEKYRKSEAVEGRYQKHLGEGLDPGMAEAEIKHDFKNELLRTGDRIAAKALAGLDDAVRRQVFESFSKSQSGMNQYIAFASLFGPRGDADNPYPNAPDDIYETMRQKFPGLLPERGKKRSGAAAAGAEPAPEDSNVVGGLSMDLVKWVRVYLEEHPAVFQLETVVSAWQAANPGLTLDDGARQTISNLLDEAIKDPMRGLRSRRGAAPEETTDADEPKRVAIPPAVVGEVKHRVRNHQTNGAMTVGGVRYGFHYDAATGKIWVSPGEDAPVAIPFAPGRNR